MTEMEVSTRSAQENSYYLELDLVDGEWSNAIRIPSGDINYVVIVITAEEEASDAHMQVSLSESDTGALWIDFEDGEINPAINLFRAKVDGGAGTLQLRCQ